MKLQAGIEARAIGTEDHFLCSGPGDGLHDVIEAPYPRCIRIDIGIAHELIHDLLLRPPIVAEAAEMRDDEIDVGVARSHHVNHKGLSGHIEEYRQAEGPPGLVHFPRWPCV